MKRTNLHLQAVALLLLLLLASLTAASWMRRAAVGSWLGYLPREHQVFVVTGDLATLWTSIEHHFGTAIRETERGGWLTELATALDESLVEFGSPIRSVADLERYGFDPTRGAAWSVGLPGRAEPAVYFLLPVADRDRMVEWFNAMQGGSVPETHRIDGPNGSFEALSYDADTWFAFPETDVAVLTDSLQLLERGVLQHDANLHGLRNNDALLDALANLRGPGGRAVIHWRNGAPPLQSATAVLTFEAETVRVEASAQLTRGGLQIVEDLLRATPTPTPTSATVTTTLPDELAALVTVDDAAIPRYLRFAGRFAGAARFMQESYGGILTTLRDAVGLERVSVAVTGYRDGLPEIVLVLDGDAAALERMVRHQQKRLAEQRDRQVLDGALGLWEKEETRRERVAGVTLSRLEQAGLLDPDPALADYTFDRDPSASGVIVNGSPAESRFTGPDYVHAVAGRRVSYLAPPRNANDLRYLLDAQGADAAQDAAAAQDDDDAPNNDDAPDAGTAHDPDDPDDPDDADDGAPIDTAAFVDDRFRLATATIDGRLWVATDAEAFAILPGDSVAAVVPIWQPLRQGQGAKAWVGLDVERMIESGLLTPEPAVQEAVRHYLMDLREHPAALVQLRADPLAGVIRVELILARSAALGGAR